MRGISTATPVGFVSGVCGQCILCPSPGFQSAIVDAVIVILVARNIAHIRVTTNFFLNTFHLPSSRTGRALVFAGIEVSRSPPSFVIAPHMGAQPCVFFHLGWDMNPFMAIYTFGIIIGMII
jgi:hypothetical protein